MNETLEVYNKIVRLKDEDRRRQGWVNRHIPGRIETVAEHCFAMTNLAILINMQYNLSLDMEKVLTMINIHEYGEIYVGDITPKDGVSKEEKYQKELEAIAMVMGKHSGNEKIINLWIEFEFLETDEAIFVFLLDKFQSVLQAKEYAEKHQMPEVYEEFINWYNSSVITKVKNNPLTRILSLSNKSCI